MIRRFLRWLQPLSPSFLCHLVLELDRSLNLMTLQSPSISASWKYVQLPSQVATREIMLLVCKHSSEPSKMPPPSDLLLLAFLMIEILPLFRLHQVVDFEFYRTYNVHYLACQRPEAQIVKRLMVLWLFRRIHRCICEKMNIVGAESSRKEKKKEEWI